MLDHLALSDNGFLFDTKTGATFSLSPSGTYLLKVLIAGTPPRDLPDHLVATFEVTPPVATRDVERFLQRLDDLGIPTPSAPAQQGGLR